MTNKHLRAIRSGEVTKANVRGLRMAIHADERRRMGYSVSSTAPRSIPNEEWETIMEALADIQPRAMGELHDAGMKMLTAKRYRKQLAPVSGIIADLASFHLVGFDIDAHGRATPVYRARDSRGRSFPYSCRSWQSGGKGPTLESPNYW